jgi:UDP-N-acetylglucosamine 2-epimerase
VRPKHEEFILHTGQHYDDLMSDVFFRELGLPEPDVNLDAGSGSQGVQTARMLEGIEAVLQTENPDLVVVFGDANSTLAGALAAAKLNVPVAHVEAGFRSYNRAMPEEVNRVVTDHVSRYLFCATAAAVKCLEKEGIDKGVHLVGDVMYDSLLAALPAVQKQGNLLQKLGLESGTYYLATIHRPSNTDHPESLSRLIEAFGRLDAPVFFPVHPRTREALQTFGLKPPANLHLLDPVGYFDMLAFETGARAILTDSGGVQREAYFLAVPCVTLREDSEWPEVVASGWNTLAGSDVERIIEAAQRSRPETPPPPIFGDGHAASKIVEILERDPPNR